MPEYIAALLLMAFLVLPVASGAMTRTWLAIIANWTVNTLFVILSGDPVAWAWFAMADAVTAAVILRHPAGRMQAAIGWVYIAQIIVHFTFAIRGDAAGEYDYWLLLTRLAWVQLIILGGWSIGRWGKVARSHVLRRRAAMAGREGHPGMGR